MKNKTEINLIYASILLVTLGVPALLIYQWIDCARHDGTFVRGIIWYRCVSAVRD